MKLSSLANLPSRRTEENGRSGDFPSAPESAFVVRSVECGFGGGV